MPVLRWTTVNMHLAISHGVCTATAGDILICPQRHTTACTATGEHESITPARYILATTLYITTCLFTCIHLPHCWHSHHWQYAPIPTSLAQPLVTSAATRQWHMHRQLCSWSYYPSIHIQQCQHYPIDAVPSWYMREVTYHTYSISYICTAIVLLPSTLSTIDALKAIPELRNIQKGAKVGKPQINVAVAGKLWLVSSITGKKVVTQGFSRGRNLNWRRGAGQIGNSEGTERQRAWVFGHGSHSEWQVDKSRRWQCGFDQWHRSPGSPWWIRYRTI